MCIRDSFHCATPRGLIRSTTVWGNSPLQAANSIFHCATPRGLIRWVTVWGNSPLQAANSNFHGAIPRGLIRWGQLLTSGWNVNFPFVMQSMNISRIGKTPLCFPKGVHSFGHRWEQLLTSDHFIFRELLCQHFMFLMGSGGHWITKWRYINVKILVPIKQKLGFHPWPEAKQLFIHTWLKAKQCYVECLSLKIFIKREKLEDNEFWNIYFFDNSWTHHEWGFFKCVKGHKAPRSLAFQVCQVASRGGVLPQGRWRCSAAIGTLSLHICCRPWRKSWQKKRRVATEPHRSHGSRESSPLSKHVQVMQRRTARAPRREHAAPSLIPFSSDFS